MQENNSVALQAPLTRMYISRGKCEVVLAVAKSSLGCQRKMWSGACSGKKLARLLGCYGWLLGCSGWLLGCC